MILRLLCLLLASAFPAGAFELALPLDCTYGDTCFVQNYVDRDPGPEARDFTCGGLVYDGHDGTDFALPSLAAMDQGVTVRAAAAGTVKGMRDGVPDISIRDPAAPPLNGKDCGNGVLIDHAGGWQTQYCHLKRGSVVVRSGDVVQAGTALGQVGLSGNTEFPHLHITLRKDGVAVDPFDPDGAPTCGNAPAPELWAAPLPYLPGGLISVGLSTAVPDYDAVQAGLPDTPIAPDAPALVLWANAFGTRAGDTLHLTITGPEGVVFDDTVAFEKPQARAFRAAGKRLKAMLPPGSYTGTAVLMRDGAEISRKTTTIAIGA